MLFNLKPTRQAKEEETHIVADLDAIDVRPAKFKWDGKIHEIRAVNTFEYLKVTEIFARMDMLSKRSDFTVQELAEVYADLITSVCDTIKRDDVYKMTNQQIGALFQLILDQVSGRLTKYDAEKKNLTQADQKTASK